MLIQNLNRTGKQIAPAYRLLCCYRGPRKAPVCAPSLEILSCPNRKRVASKTFLKLELRGKLKANRVALDEKEAAKLKNSVCEL